MVNGLWEGKRAAERKVAEILIRAATVKLVTC